RTSFEAIGGEPVQKIHDYKEVEFKIEYYDINNREEKKPQSIIKTFIRPFDLSRAPLLRVGLIHTPRPLRGNPSQEGSFKDKYIMMFDMHHIITDGISQQVLTSEFVLLYTGRALSPLKLQYKDYSEWQNSEEQQKVTKTREMYWLKQFQGEVPLLDLPTDYTRPGRLTTVGKRLPFRLEKELVHKLRPLLSETETTLFMLLLAAYYVLLFIYTRQEDIIVGSPVGGRRHDNLQNIVGMFVNMLTIRNQPQSHKTFKEFLNEVKINSLNAFENQEYQFEELVDNLNIHRDLSRRPLVETVFTLQSTFNPGRSKYRHQENGLKVKPYPYEVGNVKFDLTLDAVEVKDSIEMWWTYAVELFKSTTIDKFKDHYIEILEQAAANITVKIKDIKVSHNLVSAGSNPLQTDRGDFGF
ncbi:condensation domain-containing protein, partial [Acidobacteriota bacterium]